MTISPLCFKAIFNFAFHNPNLRKGVTLLELLIVLMIIGLLVTAAVRTWDVSLQRSRFNSTVKEMEQLVWAIAGNPDLISAGKRTDFGYVGDNGVLPPTLRDLRENISNYITWRGPYIQPAFQESPQSYMIDAWGDTYVYPHPFTIPDTAPIYIRSYGGGSVAIPQTWLTKIVANRMSDLLANMVAGNIYDGYNKPLGTSDQDTVWLQLYYPRLGRQDSLILAVFGKSDFEFTGIPVGNHRIKAMAVHHEDTIVMRDTVEKYICVYPRVGATDIEIRFPGIRFGEIE